MPVAQGGMAAVWAARLAGTRGFQKIVAIKTMLPDAPTTPTSRRCSSTRRGSRRASGTPNVRRDPRPRRGGRRPLHRDGVGRRRDGRHAAEAAKRLGGIPLRIVLRIASQIRAGLHNAHELATTTASCSDLVHRDISPANVLASTAGIVKIVDFGVAKSKGRLHDTRAGGIVKGKTPYLSPEQLPAGSIDRRTTCFSLGVLLYVLTTGLHPFRGETDLATIENITIKTPPPLRELKRRDPPRARTGSSSRRSRRTPRAASTRGDAAGHRTRSRRRSASPRPTRTWRPSCGRRSARSSRKRAQELRDAIAAVDAGAAVNSRRRPGASLEGHAALADVGAGSHEGGPAAASPAAPAPAALVRRPAGGGITDRGGGAAGQPGADLVRRDRRRRSPAEAPRRSSSRPRQPDVAPGEPTEPVSPRPAAWEGQAARPVRQADPPGGRRARHEGARGGGDRPLVPRRGAQRTPEGAAAEPRPRRRRGHGGRPIVRDRAATQAAPADRGWRGDVLHGARSRRAGQCAAANESLASRRSARRASMRCPRPRRGRHHRGCGGGRPDSAPFRRWSLQSAQPASPARSRGVGDASRHAGRPRRRLPKQSRRLPRRPRRPRPRRAQPIAAPQASPPPSTTRPRRTSTPAKPAPKPATTGKPNPKEKYNPSRYLNTVRSRPWPALLFGGIWPVLARPRARRPARTQASRLRAGAVEKANHLLALPYESSALLASSNLGLHATAEPRTPPYIAALRPGGFGRAHRGYLDSIRSRRRKPWSWAKEQVPRQRRRSRWRVERRPARKIAQRHGHGRAPGRRPRSRWPARTSCAAVGKPFPTSPARPRSSCAPVHLDFRRPRSLGGEAKTRQLDAEARAARPRPSPALRRPLRGPEPAFRKRPRRGACAATPTPLAAWVWRGSRVPPSPG